MVEELDLFDLFVRVPSSPPSPGQVSIFPNVSFQSLSHPKFKMAESDEEVDVEDVSDGEQTTNLRVFGDDDQKDKWYSNVLCFIFNNFID